MSTIPNVFTGNWGAKASAASQAVPHDQVGVEGREDAHKQHPTFCLRVERPNGDCHSIMYGTFVGSPFYYPSHGIQFVFEGLHPKHGWALPGEARNPWVMARWCVSILGHGLKAQYDHICDSKEIFIRVGENVTDVLIEEMEVETSRTLGRRE